MARHVASLALFALAWSSSPPLSADVLEVGPGQPFAQVQQAVDVAQDGDLVLVETGGYGPVVIEGVALTVAAARGADVEVQGIAVRDLAAAQVVVLQHLRSRSFLTPPLELADNAGSVRVEDCDLAGRSQVTFPPDMSTGSPAARITDSADVAFVRSFLRAGPLVLGTGAFTGAQASGAGVEAEGSCVVLYDCEVTGEGGILASIPPVGSMTVVPGGPGLSLLDAHVFASGCSITGGRGGEHMAFPPGNVLFGDGGPGALVDGTSSRLVLLDSALTGGAAANGGGSLVGPVSTVLAGDLDTLAGSARHAVLGRRLVSEGTAARFRLEGEPLDVVTLVVALDTAHVYSDALHGAQLVSFPGATAMRVLGVIPPSGVLESKIPLRPLPDGLESRNTFFQAVFTSAADGDFVGPPATLIVLDSGS